jgi:diguanylate cyclase (GGDEF)-like protein
LRELAHFLRRRVRVRAGCVRLGADEFVVVLSGAGLEGRVTVLSHLWDTLNETHKQALALSIGGATWSIDGRSSEGFIRVADRAMYLDKRQ